MDKEQNQQLILADKLVSLRGQTYYVVIECENPGRLIRELWQAVNDIRASCFGVPTFFSCPANDEDACNEWTDRSRCYRTRVSNGKAIIKTHWHDPSGDDRELPPEIISFLLSRGLDV